MSEPGDGEGTGSYPKNPGTGQFDPSAGDGGGTYGEPNSRETHNLPPFSPPGAMDSAAAEEGLTRTELAGRRVKQFLGTAFNKVRRRSRGATLPGAISASGSTGITQSQLTSAAGGQITQNRIRRLDIRDLGKLSELGQRALQGRGYAFYGTLGTVLICAFFLADVAAMMVGGYIPEPPTARTLRNNPALLRPRGLEAYGPIFSRNLFNRKGLIPGEDNSMGDPGGAPVKTTLPWTLVGTLILRDATRSLATIEDKGASQTYPVRVDDEIPTKARILKIEPNRVIFVNLASNRREYVDLPEDLIANPVTVAAPVSGIEQVSPNQFSISHTEINKAFSNMSSILTQARAMPHFENGVPTGFQITNIVPGSIYSQLGLKDGDIVTGANGQPINDPMKAMEMFNGLKTASSLSLTVKHDGRTNNYEYDIH